MGYFIGIFSLAVLYYIIYRILKICGFDDITISKKELILSIGVIVLFMGIIINFLSRENYAPWGDFGCYWHKTVWFAEDLTINPFQAINKMFLSINNSVYNDFPCLFLAIPLKILGGSYFAFIVLAFILFYLPTAILISFLLKKIVEKNYNTEIPFYLLLICSFFPMLFIPTLLGCIGIVALPMITMCFYLVINKDYERIEYEKSLWLSVLLLSILLLRRYYAYWAVGFISWLLINFSVNCFKRKQKIVYRIKEVFVIGAFCTLVLVIFFLGYLKMSILNNYSLSYQAYKMGNVIFNIWIIIRYLGIIQAGIILIGIIIETFIKKRTFSLILSINVIITLLLFYTVQTLALHHYHIIVIQLCILTAVSMFNIIELSKKSFFKTISALLFILIILTNTYFSMNITKPNILFTNITVQPRIRNDMDVLYEIDNDITEIVRKEKIDGVYFTAMSDNFNFDHFVKLHTPNSPMKYTLYFTAHVDLRDGFETSFFQSNIVITTQPGDYSLRDEYTAAMRLLNDEFWSDTSIILDNFSLRKQYTIDNGVVVRLYVKKTEFSQEEILYLRNEFDRIYPEYPELYRDRFDTYLKNNVN